MAKRIDRSNKQDWEITNSLLISNFEYSFSKLSKKEREVYYLLRDKFDHLNNQITVKKVREYCKQNNIYGMSTNHLMEKLNRLEIKKIITLVREKNDTKIFLNTSRKFFEELFLLSIFARIGDFKMSNLKIVSPFFRGAPPYFPPAPPKSCHRFYENFDKFCRNFVGHLYTVKSLYVQCPYGSTGEGFNFVSTIISKICECKNEDEKNKLENELKELSRANSGGIFLVSLLYILYIYLYYKYYLVMSQGDFARENIELINLFYEVNSYLPENDKNLFTCEDEIFFKLMKRIFIEKDITSFDIETLRSIHHGSNLDIYPSEITDMIPVTAEQLSKVNMKIIHRAINRCNYI